MLNIYGACRQAVKTSDCDSDMRGFESHQAPQNFGSKGKGSRYKKVTKRNSYLREYKASFV